MRAPPPPPPTPHPPYYADYLCERVKQYLRPLFDGDETLYSTKVGSDDFDPEFEEERIANTVAPDMWARGQGRCDSNSWHPNHDRTMFWL